jgi:hypothetical protein
MLKLTATGVAGALTYFLPERRTRAPAAATPIPTLPTTCCREMALRSFTFDRSLSVISRVPLGLSQFAGDLL